MSDDSTESVVYYTTELDKLSYKLARRLIAMFGSEGAAEKWLETENTDVHFRGTTPAVYFAEHGEGDFLDEFSNVHVRKHLDEFLAARAREVAQAPLGGQD